MKTNAEIRAEAWNSVVRTRWMWRLSWVVVLLNAVAQIAMSLIESAYVRMEIPTWTEFVKAKVSALQQGLGYSVPSASAAWQMTGASLFETFIAYIFSAIFAFGFAVATLKAVRNDEYRWLAGSLEGFRRPLETAWLLFVMNLKVALWSLLFLVPGIVAAYRYRQAWYLKARNPDWTASECIAESGRMMDGFKWKAFALDFSFLGWFISVLVIFSVLISSGFPLLGTAAVAGMVFAVCYFFSARAVFFHELIAERGKAHGGGTVGDE